MSAGPGYDALVVGHVLVAVVGFGALFASGAHASAIRRVADPFSSGAIRRYFSPGRNLASRAVLAVPVFGAALLALGNDAGALFPWIGLGLWIVATGAASAGIWPAEAEIARLLAQGPGARGPLVAAARRCERFAALTSCCFAAAFVVMIAQPR